MFCVWRQVFDYLNIKPWAVFGVTLKRRGQLWGPSIPTTSIITINSVLRLAIVPHGRVFFHPFRHSDLGCTARNHPNLLCTTHHSTMALSGLGRVLVLNAGSSSLKFKLFDLAPALASSVGGMIDRIGDTANSALIAKKQTDNGVTKFKDQVRAGSSPTTHQRFPAQGSVQRAECHAPHASRQQQQQSMCLAPHNLCWQARPPGHAHTCCTCTTAT
jgi:hypothetical protein